MASDSNGNAGFANGCAAPGTAPLAQWDVLGKSVVDRIRERLHVFGVSEIAVISQQNVGGEHGAGAGNFWTAWNDVISLKFDLTTLLLVRVGPYVELDIADFLQFHRETSSAMTQVYDAHGALDLVAVDGTGTFRALSPCNEPPDTEFSPSSHNCSPGCVVIFITLPCDPCTGRQSLGKRMI